MTREECIDSAVCRAGQLISALLEHGPLAGGQIDLLITAAVRADVYSARMPEIQASVRRVLDDLEYVNSPEEGCAAPRRMNFFRAKHKRRK